MKLRGQRIELGEIEHALRALPGVDEAVVLVHADALVAYVSPAEVVHADETAEAAAEAEPAEGEAAGGGGFGAAVPFGRVAALAGAAAALPAYMLPSVVVGVREWPRTSSAKIDRNRLPPPEGGSGVAAEVVAPRSAAERAARDAIAAVLGLPAEGVSVEAGFFELGCLRTQIAILHTAIGLISAASLALTHLISSLPPTGGNSLHAVRCVSLLNIQLAANQQPTSDQPTASLQFLQFFGQDAKDSKESLVASDSFSADHRRFLARMVVTAEPPEVTTCRTPAYLLPATDSPPRQPPHFRANFCQFHRRYAGPPPNYALCDQGIRGNKEAGGE